MLKRIFATLILCLCVSGALVANTYGKQDIQAHSLNDTNVVERLDPQGSLINPVFQSTRYQADDVISVDFVVESQYSITNYSHQTDGFNAISVSRNANVVNARINYVSSSDNAIFSIFINISNGETIPSYIYAYKTDHGVFISQGSLDDAKERAYDYMIDNGFMTLAEREAAWRINYQKSILQIMPAFSSFSTNINGRMTWKEDTKTGNNNNSYPLQFIRIEFRNSSQTLLETTYTDINGYYSSSINPAGQINIRVYAAGLQNGNTSNVRVIRANQTEYFDEALNIDYSKPYNREYDMTSDLGRAFQISQAAITAARYAQAMRGSFLTNVPIIYPHSQTGCSYSGGSLGHGNGTILIGSSTSINFGVRIYSSWDVIMHEYGHHIQYQSGINIYGSSAGNTEHILTVNLIDHFSYTKDHGIRLAWRESWPTAFASTAQQYYVNSGQLDNRILTVGDAKYESYNGSNLDFVNMSSSTPKGEASESGVIGALWCIYSSTGKSYDKIPGIGHQAFWNLITGNTVRTFSEFSDVYYTKYPQYRSEFGQIMAYFRMAPSSVTNTAFTAATPPAFSWIGNGGGTGATTQNNKYTIVFFNENTEIYRTAAIISTSTGTITHTLSVNVWNSVIYWAGPTIKVFIMAEQTSDPLTGGYYSQALNFVTPVNYAFTTVTNSTGLTITGITGTTRGNLEIPARINGTAVTQIGNGSSSVLGSRDVFNVTFESGSLVTAIAPNAFSGATQLSQISVPDSVTSIGLGAFSGCIRLGSITLPFVGNTYYNPNINSYSFGYIFGSTSNGYQSGYIPTTLHTVTINGGYIAFYAFNNCGNIKTVKIGSNVMDIGIGAFYGCNKITEVYIYKTSATNIIPLGAGAFSSSVLTSIYVPNSECVAAYKSAENWSDYASKIKSL